MKARFLMTILALAVLVVTGAHADDAAVKKRLLGYWEAPGWQALLKEDGIIYDFHNHPIDTWDVRHGVFYTKRDSFTIIALTNSKLVIKDQAHTRNTGTWKRITAAKANR
jgi:hypothetical protein